MASIDFSDVRKSYGPMQVVHGINGQSPMVSS